MPTVTGTGTIAAGGTFEGFGCNHVVNVGTGLDSNGIQALIDGAQAGTRFVFANTTYTTDFQLIPTWDYCWFDMSLATFQTNVATPYGVTALDAKRSWWDNVGQANHLRFYRGTYHGPNTLGGTSTGAYVAALEHQHGFNLQSVDDIHILGVNIDHVYGDFVYGGPVATAPSNVKVLGCTFDSNGRMGVSVASGTDILIQGNLIQNIRQAGIDLEPNGSGTRDTIQRVTVRGNTFGNCRQNWIACGNRQAPVFTDVTIDGNVCLADTPAHFGTTLKAPFASPTVTNRRQRLTFTNNTSPNSFSSSGHLTVTVDGWDGVTCTGNSENLGVGQVFFTVTNSTSVQVHGNDPGAGIESNIVTNQFGTGRIVAGGIFHAAGIGSNPPGTARIVSGGVFRAAGFQFVTGVGVIDAGGIFTAIASGFAPDVSGTGTVDAGGTFTGAGSTNVEGTGTIDAGGTFTATGKRGRRRKGIRVGPISLRSPGFGRAPFGRGGFGGSG